MENRQHLPLRIGAEIDQQVAAGDQVHARKGRIAQHAMRRKHAKIAHLLGDDKAAALGGEETLAPLRRHVLKQRRGIAAGARRAESVFVDVGGENRHPRRRAQRVHMFAQQDGDRKNLFAGGAAGRPDPHRIGRAASLEQARNDFGFERVERFGVAEKTGHVDQQVAKQRRRLFGLALQQAGIVGQGLALMNLHAALNAAQEVRVL